MPGTANAATGIEQEMSFEGKIVTSTGTNIPDGNYNMEFKIYTGCTNNTGTGCTAVWTEDWLVGTSPMTFTSGTFQANLGSVTAFGGSVPWGTNPLYMSMQIGSTSSCTPAGNFTANCGGDGVMSPYLLLTSTPYSFNSSELNGITSSGYVQTAPTVAQTIQPTTNVTSLAIDQNNSGSFGQDVFDVQGSSGGTNNFIQVTSTAANAGAVTVQSLGSNALNLQSGGGALNVGTNGSASSITVGPTSGTTAQTVNVATSPAANTINIGTGANTSGINTINIGNGSSSTGKDVITIGTTNGASSVSIQAGSGGATLNATAGNVTVSTTTSGTLAVTSAGALNLAGGAASTLNTAGNTLAVTSSNFNVSTGGVLNVVGGSAGYQIGGAATTGNYLRGNGTSFVSSAIQFADVPTCTSSTCNYIENAANNSFTGQNAAEYLNSANASQPVAHFVQGSSATAAVLVAQSGATPGVGGTIANYLDSTGSIVESVDASGNQEQLGYNDVAGIGGTGLYGNLLTYSEQLNQSGSWTTGGTLTVNGNNAAAPDGTTTASQLVGTGSTTLIQTRTTGTTGTYTFSVWLKQSSGSGTTGICIFTTSGTPSTCTVTTVNPNSTDWQRFSVTQAVTGSPTNVKVEIAPGNGSTATIWAWGAQLVLASSPEVYVATATNIVAATPGTVANGTLTATGNSLFEDLTNSTTALQIQDASGTSFFTANSVNDSINTQDINAGSASSESGAGRPLSDSFESGNLSLWTVVQSSGSTSTITDGTSQVRDGKYAAQVNMSGTGSVTAYANIGSQTTIDERAYVYVTSQGANDMNLIGLGQSNTVGLSVYRAQTTGNLDIFSVPGATSYTSTTPLTTGTWHEIEMDVTEAAGTTGTVELYLDGVNIINRSGTATTGTTPLTQTFMGDTSARRSAQYSVDDISVDTVRPGDSASLNVGDSLHVDGSASFGNTLLLQNAANSTIAFAIQNATNNNVLTVATTNSDLVSNAGFDTSINNWTFKGASGSNTVTQDTSPGATFSGIGAIKDVVTAASNGVQTSSFTASIAAGTQYQLTFFAKCSSSIATFTYGRQDVSGTDVNATTTGTCNTNWQQYTVHYTTGGTITNPNIYMDSGTTTSVTIWVDAVSLVQTTTNAATNYQPGSVYFGGIIASPVLLENAANSTVALQVQNSGGTNVLDIDTTNSRIIIGQALTGSTSPVVLILDSGTSSTEPTEVNGAMYYSTVYNDFRCGLNGAWVDCANGAAATVTSAVGTVASTGGVANDIWVAPLYIPGTLTVNDMYVSVTTSFTSGDVGVYNSSGTLVLNGGSGSITTGTGDKVVAPTQTGTARVLAPGQYYVAITGTAAGQAAAVQNFNSVAGQIRGAELITGGGAVLPSSISLGSNQQFVIGVTLGNGAF
jgi:hypothetical protein